MSLTASEERERARAREDTHTHTHTHVFEIHTALNLSRTRTLTHTHTHTNTATSLQGLQRQTAGKNWFERLDEKIFLPIFRHPDATFKPSVEEDSDDDEH
jgi:hypothetical protein